MGSSPRTGDAARAPRNWILPSAAIALVTLLILGGSLTLAASPPRSAGSLSTSPAMILADPPTHGDLVVTSGETYTIQPTNGILPYYQGGNITVDAGGTLAIRNTTLIFVQSIYTTGTLAQRVSGLVSFTDAGAVTLTNSVITTDPYVLNAYPKLPLTITGTMTLWNSSMEFPGSVEVTGAGAALTLNHSAITQNPLILADSPQYPPVIYNDIVYAATVTASAGAQLNLFNSTLAHTYANPQVAAAPDLGFAPVPGPNATFESGRTPLVAANITFPGYPAGSYGSSEIAQAWLYASGYSAGWVSVGYSNTNTTLPGGATVSLYFAGSTYLLGTIVLPKSSTGNISVPLSAGALTAINAAGDLAYFSSSTSILLSAVTAPAVTNLTGLSLVLAPSALNYNITVEGAGTVLNSVGTSVDVNWVPFLSNPSFFPYQSNKLMLLQGAVAYLANLTVTNAYPQVFSTSAIVTDDTSTAYVYRWAEFHIRSAASGVNASGVSVAPFYAYNNNQGNNATVTALNDLATTSPAIWNYLKYWDSAQGIAHYGLSNAEGQAFLLLASGVLNSSVLPDGIFLGDYNVGFRAPYVNGTTWAAFAASAYPTGTALDTFGYGAPDRLNVTVPTAPPVVQILSISAPTSPLNLNNQYTSSGTIFLNGPGVATLVLYATPIGVGGQVVIGSTDAGNGTFAFDWTSPLPLSAGTSYTIEAVASYDGVTATHVLGVFSIPSTTSPTGFLFQKFLGLPLWVWIAIAIAAVVAILVVLLLFRRQAAGKLVECGECGELIPEDATTCPKCGAEFESDLVRCSRCSSTIPANSQFCPECGAQLLGSPGEATSDPERQAYADFTERFRAEGKKELGDNYTESAFWDWWKRQPTYVPFSQWKVQQNKGAPRAGMSQPPVGSEIAPPATGAVAAAPAPGAGPGFTAPPAAAAAPAATAAGGLKPCPNCGKEIPPEYLVCPFCGAVTQ